MRRFTTAITAAALALGMTLSVNQGTALAVPGYDSAYQFESAFLTLKPGDAGTFSVFFANTGTTAWTAGSGTQVNLAVCAADKVTCNLTSANAAWANGWLSSTAYATHTKSVVAPGDFSAFTYNVKVPAGTTAGTYRFNGDLVLASTGQGIHPEGYYQDASVSAGASGAAITATPGYSTDEDNEVSSAIPGNGQHTYTFQVNGLTGTVDITVLSSGNIVRNSDGTFAFLDDNGDKKADGTCPSGTQITAINGTSITASGCQADYAIPANGTITVTIDSATPNQRVRVVMWQDLSNNGGLDLSTAGSKPTTTAARVFGQYDVGTDGQIGVSGRKFYMGKEAVFGSQFGTTKVACDTGATPAPVFVANSAPVWRNDASTQAFSAGPTSANSNRFKYDANDIFRVQGVQVTLAQFKSNLTADSTGVGDAVSVNYSPDPAGISEFNITCNHGADAPHSGNGATPYDQTNAVANVGNGGTDPISSVGDFDSGSGVVDDVRIQFVTPDYGNVSSYQIQRADAAGAGSTSCTAADVASTKYSTIGSVTADSDMQATFTDFDRAAGKTFCYRVRVQDPTTSQENFTIVLTQTISGTGDSAKPKTNNATLTTSSGFANTLDTGDKLELTFDEQMNVAPNAVIRVTDSDCGPAANTGPATCSGGQTNTVADIICGTNANCALNSARTILTITMTSSPSIVAAGSTAGAQFPIVITDSSGITDLTGNLWDLQCDGQSVGGGLCGNGGAAKRVIP